MATKKVTSTKKTTGKHRSLAEMHRRGRDDGDAAAEMYHRTHSSSRKK